MRKQGKEATRKKSRTIIVYIATSADRYIARADGSVDWLNRPRTAGDYGMSKFFRTIDTILWGRRREIRFPLVDAFRARRLSL
jgi:hypothetical protein